MANLKDIGITMANMLFETLFHYHRLITKIMSSINTESQLSMELIILVLCLVCSLGDWIT